MASSHCHCHCLHNQQQQKYKHHQSQTSSCYCCHSTCCTPPPPPPHHHHHHQCCSSFSLPHNNNTANTSIDYPILLQTLATYILQSQSQSHFPKPKSHYHKQPQEEEEEKESPGALLTSRIDALESFLHHLSTSPPPPTPKPVPRSHSPLTLRDLAARTIQTHFRAFLVRRSRNLRHLKHLAIIKSNFTLLKSSTHLTCQALSHKAMDLLLNLNSIQDSDPMIRDGKRSISRDLLGFLEFLDNGGVSSVTVKRQLQQHKLSSSYLKQPPFEKESISESRVYSDPQEEEEDVIHNEEAEEDEQRVCSDHGHQQQQQLELVKNLRTKLEELEGCSRNSERNVMTESEEEEYVELPRNGGGKNNMKNKVGNGGQNGNLIFSAPLPVQMEPSR